MRFIIGVSPWLYILELAHFEEISLVDNGKGLMEVLLRDMTLGHGGGPGVTPGIIEAERLGSFLQNIVFLSYQFLCIFSVIIRYNIADWSSWPIGSAIRIGLLWQVNGSFRDHLHKAGQQISIGPPKRRLRSRRRRLGLQR